MTVANSPAAAVETLEGRRMLTALQFTVDPSRSIVTVSGDIDGEPLQPQATGSMTTSYSGTIESDVTDSEFNLTGSSAITAANTTAGGRQTWLPGNTPANYAGKISHGFLGTSYAAIRGAVFDLTTPGGPTPLPEDGWLSGEALSFKAVAGLVDYQIAIPPMSGSAPLGKNGSTGTGALEQPRHTVSGNVATLSVPLDVVIPFVSTGGLVGSGSVRLVGKIVATATVPPRLPAGVTASAGAAYTYANGTLTLTRGTLTFAQDVQPENVTVVTSGPESAIVLNASQHLAGLTLSGGASAVLTGSDAGAGRRLLDVPAAAFSVDAASTLDLSNNDMILRGADASLMQSVASRIAAAFAGGSWSGQGITSSAAQADASKGIGFALVNSNNGADLRFCFTWTGDADLDGAVGSGDFNLLASNFGSAGRFWSQGDFNYDGAVGAGDFNLLASHFGSEPLAPVLAEIPSPVPPTVTTGAGDTPTRKRARSPAGAGDVLAHRLSRGASRPPVFRR